MAQRILHQISSNVTKSPLLKGNISVRSSSPQNNNSVTRNIGIFNQNLVVVQSNTCQHLSRSTSKLSQTSSIHNVSGIRNRFQKIDEDEVVEEDPLEEVQDKSQETMDDRYLTRFKELLEDSDYPAQTAKEFPLNKQSLSVFTRSPSIKLNEQIVRILKTRSELPRINHRLDFEEVELQADLEYQKALRKMHKVGQKINTSQYKINILPTPKTQVNSALQSKDHVKSSEKEFYYYVNNSLQPCNIAPFGHITKSKHTEKYKSIKIITKPKIEISQIQNEEEPIMAKESINKMSRKQVKDYKQYNTYDQRKVSDEFIDQMKMLEPNYEPQKRFRYNKQYVPKNNLANEGDSKNNVSHTDLKSCQSIINNLKELNPDYVTPSTKRKINESKLIQSTINLIKDFRSAVSNSKNDILYHTIKLQHPMKKFQESTQNRKVSTSVPIKVRVGSKLNVQQGTPCSLSKHKLGQIKSNANEKILVPWPSLSDRRKINIPKSTSIYTDVHKNTSVNHNPIELKISKHHNSVSKTILHKPTEVFLPIKRTFSTKSKIALKMFENIPGKDINKLVPNPTSDKISSKLPTTINNTRERKMPKFEFKNKGDWKQNHRMNTRHVEEPKSISEANTSGNTKIQEAKVKLKFIQENNASAKLFSSQQITKDTNKCNDKRIIDKESLCSISYTKQDKTEVILSKVTLPNAIKTNQNCVRNHYEKNYPYKDGNNLSTTKLNFDLFKPLNAKLEGNHESKQTPSKLPSLYKPFQSIMTVQRQKILKPSPKSTSTYKKIPIKQTQTLQLRTTVGDVNRNMKVDSNSISTSTGKKQLLVNITQGDKEICFEPKQLEIQRDPMQGSAQKNANSSKSNNEQYVFTSIIGNIKSQNKGSAITTFSSCPGNLTKIANSDKTSNINPNEVETKINANGLQLPRVENNNIPLRQANKTGDNIFSAKENEINVNFTKLPQLTSKQNLLLNNPLTKLKVLTLTELYNFKTQSQNSLQHNGKDGKMATTSTSNKHITENSDCKLKQQSSCGNCETLVNGKNLNRITLKKSYNSRISMNQLFTEKFDNRIKRNLSTDSTLFTTRDSTARKSNFRPFLRTYCSKGVPLSGHYVKKVQLKRLKKRPGFDQDFPTRTWILMKECQSLCDRMGNPKMDKILGYEVKRKKLPVIKRSNCPCIERNGVSTTKELTKGPTVRPGYFYDYSRRCKGTLCEDIAKYRADKIAGYIIKKKILPVLKPVDRKCCLNGYNLPGHYVKRVRLKRLKKRPGYDEEFPSRNWILMKECQSLCDRMENPKMDNIMGYEVKRKKLPIIKQSNCPCIERNGVSTTKELTKGPTLRSGYVYAESKKICPPKDICDETNVSRADNAAGYVIKKKKLPPLSTGKRTFSTFSGRGLLLDTSKTATTMNKKSIHTAVPLQKQQVRRSTEKISSKTCKNGKVKIQGIPSKSRSSLQTSTSSKMKLNLERKSPYLSYSDCRTKPRSYSPVFYFNETPAYLQPNSRIIGPTFDIEPPPPNPISFTVRREENFSKIPKPNIKELNKYAIATVYASQQKVIPKIQSTFIQNTSANNMSIEAPVLTAKPFESQSTKILAKPTIKNVSNIAQVPRTDDIPKEAPLILVAESIPHSIETRNILKESLKEEFEKINQISQSSTIEIEDQKSESDTHENILISSQDLDNMQNIGKDSPEYCNKAIIPSNDVFETNCDNNDGPSLWEKITNYLKTKLEIVEVQSDKVKQDLFLCSGNEATSLGNSHHRKNHPQTNDDFHKNNRLIKTFINQKFANVQSSQQPFNKNNDSDSEAPEIRQRQISDYPYQKFCREYDAFIRELKERESASAMEAENKNESARQLKSSIERSKEILKRNNLGKLTMQSRSYSSRPPKTPYDLLEYFNKIQKDKFSNIDEEELTKNILTAIKVGMEVIKKSKLANSTDISYFDIFKQLDSVSRSELQAISPSRGDLGDSYLSPLQSTFNNLQDEENKHVVNTIQQFCKNVCDIQNCNVLEYEESERRKTENLQKVLDEILKRHAQA